MVSPDSEVLKNIADLLGVSFDDLMARAGRFGDNAERYMRRHPTAGVLFRQISDSNMADDDLVKLLRMVEELTRKRDHGK
jgi:hypothetical protein